MEYSESVTEWIKPASDILDTIDPVRMNLLHMAVGISGEVAELFEGQVGEIDELNMIEECGDLEFYLEGMQQQLDMSINASCTTMGSEESQMGLVVYAGHILDAVKRAAIYNKPLNSEVLVTAIANFKSCMMCLYLDFDLNRNDVLAANQTKLEIRYGKKYSDQAAQQRLDKEI